MAYTTFITTLQPISGAFTFIKDFHDKLIAVGLTQTADTGQLNLATAGPLRNATVNFSYGYTVYKLPSVSGLNDVFIRINHTNNNDANPISYLPRITIGTSTDGAGNITANSSTEISQPSPTVLPSTGLGIHYISLTDGDLGIAFAPTEGLAGVSQVYTISRLRNLNGTKKNGYWFLSNSAVAASNTYEYVYTPLRATIGIINHTSGSKANNSLAVPYLWFSENPDLSLFDDIPVFPPVILTPEATTCLPHLFSTNDVAIGNDFTTNKYGTARRYLRTWVNPNNTNISLNITLE